jgi:hypothetical protein
MGGDRSISLSVGALCAVAVGIALNASADVMRAGAPKTFLVAAIAGFSVRLACRAATARLRGE